MPMKPHVKLLIALVAGVVCGTLLHSSDASGFARDLSANFLEPVGQLFLRLVFMTVVPLVFSGLVLGVFELAHHRGLRKTMSKTIIYTLVASSISVFIGIGLVNLVKPGLGLELPESVVADHAAQVDKIKSNAGAAKSTVQTILELVPTNPIQAASNALNGEMIALMVFALIFAVALSGSSSENVKPKSISVFDEIYQASMRIVQWVMKLAPYAVFALVFSTSLKFGWELIRSLSLYVLVAVVGLALQQFVVYSIMLKTLAKRSPLQFFRDCYDVMIYAFATASSNATLPKSLATAEGKLKLSPQISRFVLTVGSTANQNGTALFEGVTVLFLAQVYGIDLNLSQQIQVALLSIMAGVGTAGVPGGSLPLIMIVMQQVGIPAEGLGLVLGVDRFLDMCRSAVNVTGDLVIAAVVDKD